MGFGVLLINWFIFRMARTKEGRKKEIQPTTRDYTLNMHKRLQGIAFKKRATRAVRECRRFAVKEMHTQVSRSSRLMACRMCEWTPSWTDTCGPEDAEMYQDLWESELAERRMKTKTPKKSSTALFSSLRSSPSPVSKLRGSDQVALVSLSVKIKIIIVTDKHAFFAAE